MDEGVSNHQVLLPENYIVQQVESIPISMIEYDKMGMTHLIQPGQIGNGVIQLADENSNLRTKELHPLEAEIQRDLELKQQAAAAAAAATVKRQTASIIHSPSEIPQGFVNKPKALDPAASVLNGAMEFEAIDERENLLNSNSSKAQDSAPCDISQINRSVLLEKRQFIIVSDNSVLLNIAPKEEIKDSSDGRGDPMKEANELNTANLSTQKLKEDEVTADSDSENEDDNVEPVYDYEPDPDGSPPIHTDQKEKPNKCYMCFKSFRQKKNMYAHIRKIHSTQPKIEGGILCPLCKMHTLRQEHLRNHLETLHEIRIEKEEKLFTTMEEFLSWKEYIERETLSFYVSKSSSKLLANNQQKTYYKCHRSGNYVTLKKENRKKKLKVQGSNKIGATCPAAIEIIENFHGINVTFWKTHVGHENDLAHLVLSREDRARIMDYVTSGVPWDKILEMVKMEASKDTSQPSRLTMVSKQDLRNIKKNHEMSSIRDGFSRKKTAKGRKPIKERMLRRASQSLVIEKADMLLNLLETTDVRPEFRPKICLMIDNLISTVRRRTVKAVKREHGGPRKRRRGRRSSCCEDGEDREQSSNSSEADLDTGIEESCAENVAELSDNTEKDFSEETSNERVAVGHAGSNGVFKKVTFKVCR